MKLKNFIVFSFLLLACDEKKLEVEKQHDYTAPSQVVLPTPLPSIIENKPSVVQDPFEQTVGFYSTEYSYLGKDGNRSKNVELASDKLNNTIIEPDGILSFNEIVGIRSKKAGFVDAPVIYLGELTPGVGGGVCQVSSTLYAAALASGLKILKRNPHSRPSTYIMVGLDATVSYDECDKDCGNLDLVIINPYPWPIKVKAEYTLNRKSKKKDLSIFILGIEDLGRRTEFSTKFSWFGEFKHKIKKNSFIKKEDYLKKIQSGTRGRNVVLMVTTTFPDKSKEKEIIITRYQPVDEIWEVGQNWDPSGPSPWEPKDEALNFGL